MTPAAAGASTPIALAIVKTLSLCAGGLIAFLAYRAYRRTRRRALALLAVGFVLVTLGLVLAGTLYEVLDVPLQTGILLESLLTLVGFVVIARSLYVS